MLLLYKNSVYMFSNNNLDISWYIFYKTILLHHINLFEKLVNRSTVNTVVLKSVLLLLFSSIT
jgi:hypothetical protein